MITSVPSVSLESIDWHAATYLASGCCGVVFAVSPGIVAKVALHLLPYEAGIQAQLAAEGLALPVLAYAQAQWLPPRIRQAACSLHGLRRSPFGSTCTCGLPVDILLMPRAERICTDDELQKPELIILLDRVSSRSWQLSHQLWDCHAGNVALYQGRYVALDFGDWSNTIDPLRP